MDESENGNSTGGFILRGTGRAFVEDTSSLGTNLCHHASYFGRIPSSPSDTQMAL
jgi:hypothetical protein